MKIIYNGDFMAYIKNIFRKIRSFSEKKVVTIWLVSYVIVFIIPIIISTFVSTQALGILFDQSEDLANEIIARKQDDLDLVWAECDNLFQNIYLNDRIYDAILLTDSSKISPIDSFNLKKELANIPINNHAISDIWVVFNNIEMVLSRNRYLPLKEFITVEYTNLDNPNDNSALNHEFLTRQYNGELLSDSNSLVYLKTISHFGKSGNYANLVVKIQPSFMNKNYRSLYNNEGIFFLFDKNNNLIYSDKDVDDALLAEIKNSKGKKDFTVSGEKYLKYESRDLNIKHVYVLPEKAILEKSNSLIVIVLFANFLTLLLGIFSIRYFLKRNLRPVNEIMSLIGVKGEGSNNEFSIIMHNIKEKNRDAWEMANKINAFKPLVVRNILQQLLVAGNLDSAVADKLDIKFTNPYYQLLLIDIENLGDFVNLENENEFDDAKDLSFVAVSNIFSEILSPLGKCCCGILDDTIVIVLNSSVDDFEQARQHAENAYSLSVKYLGISGRVIISSITDSLSNLPNLYKHSLNTLEYSKIMEETGIITGVASTEIPGYAPTDRTELFISQIVSGDKNAAIATIDTVIKENLLSSHVSKYSLANMLMVALNHLAERNNTVYEQIQSCDDILKVIMTANKISDVKDKVSEFISKLCIISEQNKVNDESIEEKVAQYIEENFTDTEINVKIIADLFRMTPSYLSAKFKQKIGIGILEYINQVRIEHAKKLFLSTDLSIEAVYKRCGYVSKATFLRQFKKVCGMTPTAYKEIG